MSNQFAKNAAAKPMHYPTMMVTGLGGSILLMLAFKFFAKPYAQRQQRIYGEQCADILLGPIENASTSPAVESE